MSYLFPFIIIISYLLFEWLPFWSEKKARSERSIYREISKQQKNLLFIILTIVVFATYFYVLFNHTEYFILIY